MKFENKMIVTAQNKRQLELIVGETLFVGDIVYLDDLSYQIGEEKKPDLLSYLYQEIPNTILIWDEDFGLNIRANLYAIDDQTLESVEEDLERLVIGTYGECN